MTSLFPTGWDRPIDTRDETSIDRLFDIGGSLADLGQPAIRHRPSAKRNNPNREKQRAAKKARKLMKRGRP